MLLQTSSLQSLIKCLHSDAILTQMINDMPPMALPCSIQSIKKRLLNSINLTNFEYIEDDAPRSYIPHFQNLCKVLELTNLHPYLPWLVLINKLFLIANSPLMGDPTMLAADLPLLNLALKKRYAHKCSWDKMVPIPTEQQHLPRSNLLTLTISPVPSILSPDPVTMISKSSHPTQPHIWVALLVERKVFIIGRIIIVWLKLMWVGYWIKTNSSETDFGAFVALCCKCGGEGHCSTNWATPDSYIVQESALFSTPRYLN